VGALPGAEVRQSLVALGLNSTTSLVAGAVLGSMTATLAEFPGLLVLVPAAIGLRGNVFSTFGSRISTALHAGQLTVALRRRTLLGQNVEASLVLTLAMSVVIAVVAWVVAVVIGVEQPTPPTVLVLISVLGGLVASLVVLGVTLVMIRGAVRFGWDLDDVVAPVVSTFGDVVTLPALWLAARLARVEGAASPLGVVLGVVALVVVARATRTPHEALRRVVRESWPILGAAALVSTLAGVVLETRLAALQVLPALLVLQPALTSSAGALGGILASRTASGLHLGYALPSLRPGRQVRADAGFVAGLALPVAVLNGIGASVLARLLGLDGPTTATLVGVAVVAGVLAAAFALVVAYATSVAAFAHGVDPDSFGIPAVTSSVDLAGVVALVATASLFSLL